MTDRSKKYLFHVVEELELRNMPTELALLPFIESAFNPQAVSSAKAAGMWQFMPATGKYFELKQNAFRDDRRDVLASTRAALDYLQKLYERDTDYSIKGLSASIEPILLAVIGVLVLLLALGVFLPLSPRWNASSASNAAPVAPVA